VVEIGTLWAEGGDKEEGEEGEEITNYQLRDCGNNQQPTTKDE